MPSFRFLPRRALATLAGVVLAASLAFQPLAAGASQPDTDIILGEPESERQDAANDRPNIEARNAIVMSADGTVYFEREADAQVKIASITKVMTAILAIENASLDDMVTVDHAAATVGQSSANLKEGDTLTMEAALRALLIPSGNDAAMAIATTVGAKIDPASTDPWGTFVQAMNDKAAEIGMASTKFTNPHGLDFDGWENDMHSTARDVATMLAYAMKNETFRQIDSSDNNVITVTGADGSSATSPCAATTPFWARAATSAQDGSTYEALNCFAGVFSREPGGEIYSIVLGCEEDEQRLAESMALADWYYNHTVDYPVVNTEQTTPDGEPLIARAPHADWTDKSVDVTTTDTGSTVVLFSLAGEVEQDVELQTITGDVTEGQSVGTLTLSQDGEELASVELVSAENVEAPDR